MITNKRSTLTELKVVSSELWLFNLDSGSVIKIQEETEEKMGSGSNKVAQFLDRIELDSDGKSAQHNTNRWHVGVKQKDAFWARMPLGYFFFSVYCVFISDKAIKRKHAERHRDR